jgi:putative nucleotidyltransferase with HDIG domain
VTLWSTAPDAELASERWQRFAAGFSEATGATVALVDMRERETIERGVPSAASRFCSLLTGSTPGQGISCVHGVERSPLLEGAGTVRGACPAGLPVILHPVLIDGERRAHVLVAGFLSGPGGVDALTDRLVAAGVDAAAARSHVATVPVLAADRGRALAVHAALQAAAIAQGGQAREDASLLVHGAHDVRNLELAVLSGFAQAAATAPDPATVLELLCGVALRSEQVAAAAVLCTVDGTVHATAACAHDVEPDAARAAFADVLGASADELRIVRSPMADACTHDCVVTVELPVEADGVSGRLVLLGDHAVDDEAAFNRALAQVTAGALASLARHERVRADLEKTVRTLSTYADARNRNPVGHAQRVMDLAVDTARRMGLSRAQIETVRVAGLLHDVGKLGVPEEILVKPSALTDEEFEQVRQHAELGARIVEQMDFLAQLAPAILHHHERWDGTGYPQQLAGEAIPVTARVLAVADAWAAMTAERSWRPALRPDEARALLQRDAGTAFDPAVVDAAIDVIDDRVAAASLGALAPDVSDQTPRFLS